MRKLAFSFLSCVSLLTATGAREGRPGSGQISAKLPISFEVNLGQTDDRVRFLSRGPGFASFLTSTEAVAVTASAKGPVVLKTKLRNGNSHPELVGLDPLPGRVNYFRGSDPRKWHPDVPTYARVRYREVYPGIDLIYHGRQGQLEYDFIARAGADPKLIAVEFEGVESLDLTAEGNLVLHTAAGSILHRKPSIYQEVDGARRSVAGGYTLQGATRVGFRLGDYDRRRTLVIDPTLDFSTYLGGSGEDLAHALAL